MRGDQEAITALVVSATPTALAAARRITGDTSLAEDAAQDAFVKAFRALDRFRPQSNFRAWVRAIAIRCAIDLVRRRRPESPLPDAQAAPGDEEARHEDRDLLRAALAALPRLDREIMIAREVEGVPDRVIAERFELSVTAVRVRVHRARRRIRARFEEERP
ncbi:MAG TPA: sigma-70 family RNA polymerase sigma factor [Thermoanaerobaculia bacterium]|nr:sigma-70 family RNA polymerase sigma factor [Thermoanaerobaculia bacterium]